MSDPTKAVFLSYASQDAVAAKRICDALRAAGLEVWFDQSELRGGDSWDAQIRRQIKECALFVPIISANTNARAEGYFRLEWKLAVDRSHLMADDAHFLFPVVIDETADVTARVPDKFRDVQWTRLNVKDTPETLALRVGKLLGGSMEAGRPRPAGRSAGRSSHWMRNLGMVMGLAIGLLYALRPLWAPARRPEPKPVAVGPAEKPATPARSEARQLAEKARALFDKIDSNADDFAVAESLLKRALELDATDGQIWAYSARLNAAYLTRSFERGTARAETARNHAERAVKLAPESAEAWHALGRAIWRSDPPRAEEALRHALQLAPDDGRILISLGSICRNAGHDEEALAFYVRAAGQPEVRPLALYDQFLIHLYLRRFAEAERSGREASALLPTTNSITGLAMLEIVWHGRVDSAQRTLEAAPAAMRSEPRMVFATALAALMAKQSDEALQALDRLPGDFINDAWYSGPKALLVGFAHAQAGRPEAARIAWEAGLAVVHRRLQETPNDAELHLRLGELFAWTGQAEPALHEARAFEELARNRVDWTASSARIYAALGRADAAVPILEKFLTATATGRWPLTPALLRLDPLWDRIRDDPRFQELCVEPAEKPAAVGPKPDDKSVAVLAFANLSDDKANEYFSDGISEELLNVLTKIPELKVSARTSAFSFKGKEVPVPEIARQLGVAYVVEGSVRKQGDKVRITAQLIKAADGFHVWSDTFTRDLKDVFAVQDEIAGLIAQNLQLKIGLAPATAAVNPEAYQHLLRARFFSRQDNNDGWQRGIEECKAALAIDPAYALAAAEMARSYIQLARFGGIVAAEGYRLARGPAELALRLNPDLAEAHDAMGWVQRTADWNWRGADASFRRAYELAPRNVTMIIDYAIVRSNQGYNDDARLLARTAIELDPLNATVRGHSALFLGWFNESRLQVEEAIAQLKHGLQFSPEAVEWHEYLSRFQLLLGRVDEAAASAELEPSLRYRLVARALVQVGRKDRAGAEASLRELKEKFAGEMSFYIGEVYAFAGENDQAFAWLERARQQRETSVCWIMGSPAMKPIMDDPRWNELLKKLGHEVPPPKS